MSLTESRETSSLSGRLMADLGAQLPAGGIGLVPCWATLALLLARFPAGAHYGGVICTLECASALGNPAMSALPVRRGRFLG
jgi:hypothetical protein